MKYQIRKATEKDVETIYPYICLLEESKFNFELFSTIYKENISSKNCIYLVAESTTADVIGFISCHLQNLLHHCSKVAEIQELYVDEAYRKMSIGKALVNAVEKNLRELSCTSFEVTAQNKRLQTHRFYENMGFKNTHNKFVKQLIDA